MFSVNQATQHTLFLQKGIKTIITKIESLQRRAMFSVNQATQHITAIRALDLQSSGPDSVSSSLWKVS